MSDALERARAHFHDGLTHYQAGRLQEAEQAFAAAHALAPDRPSVLTNLGAVRVRLGRFADAVPLLRAATAAEPGNADAWGHLGTALAELGDLPGALEALDRAIALNADVAECWSRRGSVLRELGRLAEAAAAFERAIALGADDDLHRYYLAACRGQTVPAPPRDYVQGLFDLYAHDFSGHLVQALRYQAHERLVAQVRALAPGRRWGRVLDLGCGTGLVGALIRPHAGHVTGIDLSPAMVAQAQASGHYDAVVQGDIVEALAGDGAPPDLVLAADVFIYVGALEATFAAVARRLAPGGLFAFSVEALTPGEAGHDAAFVLRPSLRYAHGAAYVRALAQAHGLGVRACDAAPIREDQRRPVAGLYWVLARDG